MKEGSEGIYHIFFVKESKNTVKESFMVLRNILVIKSYQLCLTKKV